MVEKVWVNYVVDVLLLIAFVVMFFTGIYKFALVYGLFPPGPKGIPLFVVSRIHDFAGLSMLVLALVHVILNWNFLAVMTKRIFRR